MEIREKDYYSFISRIMETYLAEHPDEAEECRASYAAMVQRFDQDDRF